jgi:hypothetical protein
VFARARRACETRQKLTCAVLSMSARLVSAASIGDELPDDDPSRFPFVVEGKLGNGSAFKREFKSFGEDEKKQLVGQQLVDLQLENWPFSCLDLSENQFVVLPPFVETAIRLRDLAAEKCRLTNAPNVSYLKRLQYLIFAENLLTVAPLGLSNLVALAELDLSDNKIRLLCRNVWLAL